MEFPYQKKGVTPFVFQEQVKLVISPVFVVVVGGGGVLAFTVAATLFTYFVPCEHFFRNSLASYFST